MDELYITLSTKVAPQKVLNLENLNKRHYFLTDVWVMKKLGLEQLFGIQQNYHIPTIQRFYATVVFGDDEDDDDIPMACMTETVKRESSIKRMAELLGYEFKGADEPVGERMHHEGH